MNRKTPHRKVKIEQHEHYQVTWGEHRCHRRLSSSCSTSGTRRVTVKNIHW